MPRLFTAIALPQPLVQSLAALQPEPAPGLWLVAAEQMHLTLHFIGEAEVAHIAQALAAVEPQPFSLELAGVGQFSQGAVLWAGVQANAALLDLHAAIGRALAQAGIALETRPYRPHVTLARCRTAKPALPRHMLDSFLARGAAVRLPVMAVTRFALYSSHASAQGPVYRVQKWFPAQRQD